MNLYGCVFEGKQENHIVRLFVGCITVECSFVETFLGHPLKAAVSKLGLNPDDFSSHSFRAGRTTDLVEMDCPDATIRVSGRWKSSAILEYH